MSWVGKPRIALRRSGKGSIFAGRAKAKSTVPSRGLLMLSLITTCVLVVALVTYSQWRDRQRQLAGASAKAATLARVLEEQMVSLFHGADQALIGIAEELRREPAIEANDPGFSNSLRRRLRKLPAARALFVIGSDGYIIQDSDSTTPTRNLADRRYFQVHQRDARTELFIDDPLISRSTGNWFVALSRRLETSRGEFAGVVVAAVDISYFENFYAELSLGVDDAVTLVTKEAVLIVRQPRTEAKVGTRFVPPNERSILERALEHAPVGIFEAVSPVDGVQRIFGYRALPEHPLVVLVGISRNSILGPWRQSATVAGLATASVIGISAFLWWLSLRYARREAEARAVSAQAAKLEAIGRTTSAAAHDFNNLLTAMGGALRLLGKRLRDDEHAAKIVEQGVASVEQGRSLVAQLLDITRQKVELEVLDINTVLSSMTTLLNSVAAPKARVELDLAPDLGHCHLDPSRLGAAILNLVMNACDAIGEDREGLIVISSSNHDLRERNAEAPDEAHFVFVNVRDDGTGMAPEVRRRALEPFFTTKGKRGTGLGLSQVHTFVKDMGGSMDIESEEGKGSAIHLRFPRTDVVSPRAAPQESSDTYRVNLA